jgi:hypothetical protein
VDKVTKSINGNKGPPTVTNQLRTAERSQVAPSSKGPGGSGVRRTMSSWVG